MHIKDTRTNENRFACGGFQWVRLKEGSFVRMGERTRHRRAVNNHVQLFNQVFFPFFPKEPGHEKPRHLRKKMISGL